MTISDSDNLELEVRWNVGKVAFDPWRLNPWVWLQRQSLNRLDSYRQFFSLLLHHATCDKKINYAMWFLTYQLMKIGKTYTEIIHAIEARIRISHTPSVCPDVTQLCCHSSLRETHLWLERSTASRMDCSGLPAPERDVRDQNDELEGICYIIWRCKLSGHIHCLE